MCGRLPEEAPGIAGARPNERMPRNVLILANPQAGRARGRHLAAVVSGLENFGCAVVTRWTSSSEDAERMAREAETRFDIIAAAGGDGTVNDIANGLHGSGRPLAVIPIGTANVLAREIGLPREPQAQATLIASGQPRPVWPGIIGRRLFMIMAGCGFDAEVVAGVSPGLKQRIGRFAFLWSILVCLGRYRRCELKIEIDGVEHRAASAIVARARHYAGRFVLVPASRLGDPTLAVVLFRRAGRLAAIRYLAALGFGYLHRLPDVAILDANAVSLAASEPGRVHVDGEIGAWLPVTIAVAATPILLVQPAAGPSL